jgi:hypothetical protein
LRIFLSLTTIRPPDVRPRAASRGGDGRQSLRYKGDERSGVEEAKGRNRLVKTLMRPRTPELLHNFASMGHGDELALVDAHLHPSRWREG